MSSSAGKRVPESEDLEGIDPNDPLHASKPDLSKKKLFAYDWGNGYISPWRPTKEGVLENIVEVLEELVPRLAMGGEGTVSLVDLGCGDGRVACRLAEAIPSVYATGVDLDAEMIVKAKELALQSSCSPRVTFLVGDICSTDLSGFSIVYVFILPEGLKKLSHVLRDVYERGGVIISVIWPLEGWSDRVWAGPFKGATHLTDSDYAKMEFRVYFKG